MSKYTKKAIVDSFMELLQKKSLDKITVKDIIESAEINRNTFYYHFQDIYDLLDKVFEEESIRFRSEANINSTFYEEYIRLANYFYQYKEAIIHIYYSKSRNVLNRFLESSIGDFVSRFVRSAAKGTTLSQAGEDYITYFYTYAIMGATLRWVDRKMPDYQDGLIKTISDSFEMTIDDMIQAYVNGHKI